MARCEGCDGFMGQPSDDGLCVACGAAMFLESSRLQSSAWGQTPPPPPPPTPWKPPAPAWPGGQCENCREPISQWAVELSGLCDTCAEVDPVAECPTCGRSISTLELEDLGACIRCADPDSPR